MTLVTYDAFAELTPDDNVLRRVLEECGARVRAAVWRDCFHRVEEFSAWLDMVEHATRLVNRAPVVRWNMHKRYLADLERRGIRIVPTVFVEKQMVATLAAICRANRWTDVVVKPAISGSAFGTERFTDNAIPKNAPL